MSESAVCPVCFRHCVLSEGASGFCRARKNIGGKSVCINYGKVMSLALDPVEKKPLARFYPGSMVLSAGSFGCNLDCPFCQNHEISRAGEEDAGWRYISPEELADTAEKLILRGNIGAAFTYNEPMVGYEYVRDAAKAVRERGMKTVVVTNGTAEPFALREILPYVDAFNIDLKGFTAEWYKGLGGDFATVLSFISEAAKTAHVELTTLVIPGGNDDADDMRRLAQWVASVDKNIPLHITRFFPRWHMKDASPTDVETLYRLADVAREKLGFVYVGNV